MFRYSIVVLNTGVIYTHQGKNPLFAPFLPQATRTTLSQLVEDGE
jgi:hypothetical protein